MGLVILFIAVLCMLLPVVATGVASVRMGRARSLMNYVAIAVRVGVPIHHVLDGVIPSHGFFMRHRLSHVWRRLSDGWSVGDALAAMPEINPQTCDLLNEAERRGHLGETVTRLVEAENARLGMSRGWATLLLAVTYPLVVAAFVAFVISGTGVFVVPSLEKIYADFQTPLPIGLDFLFLDSFMILPLLVMAAAVIYELAAIAVLFDVHRHIWRGMGSLLDHVVWRLPLVSWWCRSRELGNLYAFVGGELRCGVDVREALEAAMMVRFNRAMKHCVSRITMGLDQGQSLDEAVRGSRLPRFDRRMLATAVVQGGEHAMTDRLAYLSRFHDERLKHWLRMFRELWVPTMTIILAVIVGLIAYAVVVLTMGVVDSSYAAHPFSGMESSW